MSAYFVPNTTGLDLLMTRNPLLANELERIGDRVVTETKINLGRQVPLVFRSSWRNPPPGPPHRRTGDLQQSVRREDARVVGGVLTVDCVADAVHRGWYYDQVLRERGYEFVNLSSI